MCTIDLGYHTVCVPIPLSTKDVPIAKANVWRAWLSRLNVHVFAASVLLQPCVSPLAHGASIKSAQ